MKIHNYQKAIIFDLDGTLIDSVSVYLEIFLMLTRKFGKSGEVFNENDFLRFNGMDIPSVIKKLLSEKRVKISILPYLFFNKKKLAEEIRAKTKLFPQTRECLDKLTSFPMAIATSASADYSAYNLNRFNISHFFKYCITKEATKNKKPAPDLFLLVSEKLKILPENCIVIEDSLNGVIAAKRAGMKCIAVLSTTPRDYFTGESTPDLIINNLGELTENLINEFSTTGST